MARWSREQPVDQLATHIPAAVAADLLVILLLARWVQLDIAIVSSRLGWALVAAWLAVRRVRRPRAPLGGPRIPVLVMGFAALFGLALSAWLSRRYVIWDRDWHIPLVASLRGQSIPFVNVYQPQINLGYHVSGDVLGATLQALSGVRLHSSVALSLAHDLLFMLTAICISALLWRPARGLAWSLFAAVAPLAVFLEGPPNVGFLGIGYSVFNLYQMSYRPHVVLAILLIVGLTAVTLKLIYPPSDASPRPRVVPLMLMIALLALTDEPSAFMVVPAVGLVALLAHRRLERRFQWAFLLLAMTAAAAAALALLPSTLRGGPRLPTQLVAPQVPSFFAPTLPLWSLDGVRTLLTDLLPLLGLILVLGVLALRSRRPAVLETLIFGSVLLAMSTVLLTCVVVASRPGESHRFMTLPQLVLPLLVLYVVDQMPTLERVGAATALFVPITFTVFWAIDVESELQLAYRVESFSAGMHGLDCREATGARLFEQPRPTYVSKLEWFMWTGCHPVLAPGRRAGKGPKMDVHGPLVEREAVIALGAHFVGPAEDLHVACPIAASGDAICRKAEAVGNCVQMGTDWRTCAVSTADRQALLAP